MTIADILGSIGVSLLLIAFLLNLRKIIGADHLLYILFNVVGAALCGYSSYLIGFYPFVVLESVWVLAAISTLFKRSTWNLNN